MVGKGGGRDGSNWSNVCIKGAGSHEVAVVVLLGG